LNSIAACFDYKGAANKRMRKTYTIEMKQKAIAYVFHHANVLGLSMHAAYDRFQIQVCDVPINTLKKWIMNKSKIMQVNGNAKLKKKALGARDGPRN